MAELKIRTGSFEEYMESSLDILRDQLERFFGSDRCPDIKAIKEKVEQINAYPFLDKLEPVKPEHLTILDESQHDLKEAEDAVLEGEFFWEHTAAGEATRLGLGAKYLLRLHKYSVECINSMIVDELKRDGKPHDAQTPDAVRGIIGDEPENLMPLMLGTRHMLQMIFDIIKLAKRHSHDPKKVLKKQKALIILSESAAEDIISDFRDFNFFGLSQKNVFFMIQRSFHGIDIDINGRLFYDTHDEHNKRLHNHGQMLLQKAHDNVIFFIDPDSSQRIFLKSEEFEDMLQDMKDMVSYNIEDVGYLTGSIDWPSLALALKLSKEGYEMMMEIVAQNPLKPQKGGAAFYCPVLKRVCMIESNRLLGMKNEDITHLNKNFNHYPKPAVAYKKMKQLGIYMPFEIKESKDKDGNTRYYIYFNPVQGDLNFHLKTAYVMRKELKSIKNLKSSVTLPVTLKAMFEQDNQPGFKEFVDDIKRGVYS